MGHNGAYIAALCFSKKVFVSSSIVVHNTRVAERFPSFRQCTHVHTAKKKAKCRREPPTLFAREGGWEGRDGCDERRGSFKPCTWQHTS